MRRTTGRRALPTLVIVAVAAGGAALPSSAAPGRAAGLLAFQRQVGTHPEIFTVRPDGRGLHQLTHLRACDALGPALSPDGTQIAFACDYAAGTTKEHVDIFTMRSNGSDLHAMGLTGLNGDPTWTRDGRLVWVRPDGFATSAPGSDDVQRIRVGGDDASPTLSPDGSQIAFLRALPHGARAIYVARADGTHPRRVLTSKGGLGDRIGWSPDGTRIGYSSPEFGWHGTSSNIYSVRAGGGGIAQLTHDTGGTINDGFDSWSPDATRLAFVSNRSGQYEIYSMRVDGSAVTRITRGPESHLASWGPAATPAGASRGFDPTAPQNIGASPAQ